MEIHLEGRLPKSPAAAIHLAGRSCNHLRRVRLRRDPTDMITTRRTVSEKSEIALNVGQKTIPSASQAV